MDATSSTAAAYQRQSLLKTSKPGLFETTALPPKRENKEPPLIMIWFLGKKQLCQLQKNSVTHSNLEWTGVINATIFLTHKVSIKQKPYHVPHVIIEHVEEILEKDIIESPTPPYASPVVLVPKKNYPKARLCMDYSRRERAIHPEAYPLPNIQEILELLAGAAVFTTLNVSSGYW